MMTAKKLFFYCILIIIPLAFFELTFRLLPTAFTPRMMPVNDSNPVARYEPNVEFNYSHGWNFSIRTFKRSNNYGYFHQADFFPDLKTPLLMVIGDSFVQANEVNVGESAAEILHKLYDGRGRVYSMGLSGAPLSQYLPMAEFARDKFRPDGFIFVIIRNDFDESLFEYKSDPRFHYFRDVDGQRILHRVDYRQSKLNGLLRRSAFVRYLVLNLEIHNRLQNFVSRFKASNGDEPSEDDLKQAAALRLSDAKVAVNEFFNRIPEATGANPTSVLFVVDGMRPEIYDPDTLAASHDGYVAKIRQYFIDRATSSGYPVIDMQPIFVARHETDGAKFDFPTDLHWNKLGNELVAETIRQSNFFETLLNLDD